MRGIKGFDFFQKITLDNVSQPTFLGALLSLSAISLMAILLVRELFEFYTPHIVRDSVVIQDQNQNEKIPLNLGLKLSNVPCDLVSLDQEDTLRNHRFDVSDTIKKHFLNKKGRKYTPFVPSRKYETLLENIENNNGCFLKGHLDISKVPGNFHISFHNYRPQWSMLKSQSPEKADKINLSHFFESLDFGKMRSYKYYRFGLEPKAFLRTGDMPNFLNVKESSNYIYFVKIIPYLLTDENRGTNEYSYQYSISYKQIPFDKSEDDMPIILVRYEFSPITMKVTIKSRDYFHFLTHVSAIVGGIFVVFSILNRFLLGLFDFESSKK